MAKLFCTSVLLISLATACGGGGGGEKATAGSSTAANPSSAQPGSTATAASGTAAPITGKTWDVKMIGDASGYHFDPASLTIKAGDGVRWTVVSGPPHNVTFWPDSIPSGAQAQLGANMPQPVGLMTSPMLANIGETYTASFGNVPAGTYHYYCTPHLALGMKGTIIVQ